MADMGEVDQLDDSEAYFAARRIAWEDGYRAEGRTQGRVETLLRLTMRRFGTSTAEVVAVFLEGVDDAERLTKFGDWVVDCADGTDLIERIEAPPRLSPPSPTSARDGFVPLDGGAVGAHELKLDNAAALLATMEHPTPETIAERAASLHRRVRGDELRSLRELLMGWTQRLVEQRLGLDLGIDDVAEVDRLGESGDLEAYFDARRKSWEDAHRAEGREEGRVEALLGLATRRFGTAVAKVLAGFLDSVDAAERVAEVVDWIADCTTGAELIGRVEAASLR